MGRGAGSRQRHYILTLGLKIAEVREVARLMAPRLVGVAVVQVNFLLNAYLASLQPEGSYTGISLAFPLMYLPLAVIAQAVATATLPTFSAQVALGKLDEMRSSLAASLRAMLLLVIPASLGLMLLRTPLVAMLYQRGAFMADSTQLVAWALLWYAGGLVFHSLLEVVSRAFYAMHDTRTPVTTGIFAMGLN
jgi:putative peptidoglycan lipid II flippase